MHIARRAFQDREQKTWSNEPIQIRRKQEMSSSRL